MTLTPKQELRKQMRHKSLEIGKDARSIASQNLAQHLLAFVDARPTITGVLGFTSFSDEVDLRYLEAELGDRKISYLALAGSVDDSVRWRDKASDLIIVPGMAFDPAGVRLGRGKGYYDRLLHALRAKSKIVAIGVGYDHQVLDSVPKEAHDEAVDFLCTPARGLIQCHRNFSP